jgi:hypothetical protein
MMVRVLEWSAWVPGVSTRDEWVDFFRVGKRSTKGGAPDVSDISPLLRRRMSRLTRMSVAVALDCCRRATVPASDVQVIFASRHGEMGTTVDLLGQMVAGEALSPMDFSGSVHHTSAGYFSIATANRRATRAVAGGEASFCYGFLDAMGMLVESHGARILLVAADEVVPPPFAKLIGKTNFPYAAAFLLGRSLHHQKGAVSLEMPSHPLAAKEKAPRANAVGIPALDFLRWFLKENRPLEWHLSKRIWRWKK